MLNNYTDTNPILLLNKGIFNPSSTYNINLAAGISLEHQFQAPISFHSFLEVPFARAS